MPLLIAIAPEIIILSIAVLMAALQAKITSDAFAGFWSGLTPLARLVLIGPVKLSVYLARHLTHNLGQHWKQLEGIAVAWLSGLYQWSALALTQAMEWPLYLVRLQFWLLDVAIPRAIHAAIHGLHGVVKVVERQLPAITKTIVKLPKLTRAQAKALIGAAVALYVHPYLAQLRWLRAHFHALTHAIPGAITLPRWLPGIRVRVGRLEKKLAAGAILAAVIVALGRLGLGWLRCSTRQVQRTGKAVCGLDPHLFETLLLDAAAIFSIISVVEFAKELRVIEDEALTIMGKLVREWPA